MENNEKQEYGDHCVTAEDKTNVCQVESVETFKVERVFDQLITDKFWSRRKIGIINSMLVLLYISSTVYHYEQ